MKTCAVCGKPYDAEVYDGCPKCVGRLHRRIANASGAIVAIVVLAILGSCLLMSGLSSAFMQGFRGGL